MSVGISQRGGEIIEPLLSEQWFVRARPLAELAAAAVRDGTVRIVPERFEKVYFHWMDTIQDWCISRQLWWGHRIPVWYAADGSMIVPGPDDPEPQGPGITQDPDVLDTWFSSGLWPFSTLGWPHATPDLQRFYPTSVMETGYDILFFWVARMMMLGCYLTGQAPFHTIYLHGLVRDRDGRKMSKSYGNVVNPLDVMDQYGTDALRYTLATSSTPGQDLNLNPERIEAARNFANKIWNVTRFVLAKCEDVAAAEPAPATLADRWILAAYDRCCGEVHRLLSAYNFGEAGRQIHEFFWSELADWYVEVAKVQLEGDAPRRMATQQTLLRVLEGSLRLLHPFMPFVTEEAWQYLTRAVRQMWPDRTVPPSVMIATYPQAVGLGDDAAQRGFALVQEIIRGIRNVRNEYRVEPARWVAVRIAAGAQAELLAAQRTLIVRLARAADEQLEIVPAFAVPPRAAATVVVGSVEVSLPLAGLIDLTAERGRLARELDAAEADVARREARLGSEQFVARAPAAVVQRERDGLAAARDAVARLRQRLDDLDGTL
jgi:valyl-tRNA synthetase